MVEKFEEGAVMLQVPQVVAGVHDHAGSVGTVGVAGGLLSRTMTAATVEIGIN